MHRPTAAVQPRPTLPPRPVPPPKKVRPSLHLKAETGELLRRVSDAEGWTASDLADYWIRLGETASRAGYYLTPSGEMKRGVLQEILERPESGRMERRP